MKCQTLSLIQSVHEEQWFMQHYTQPLADPNRATSNKFGTYRLCDQRRFRRACASVQSRQNLRCSLIQAVSQPSDRKPDPWPLWMAGHAQLKFVMTECLKTQIRYASQQNINPEWSHWSQRKYQKICASSWEKPVFGICNQLRLKPAQPRLVM